MLNKTIEALSKGEYAIERFFGQTALYLPCTIVERIGEKNLYSLAAETFSKEPLTELHTLEKCEAKKMSFYLFCLPSVLPNSSQQDLADTLVEKILNYNKY